MEKVKYTFRLEEEILKEMKIRAVQEGIALNELLLKCWFSYINCKHEDVNNAKS